jgi:hypothetical protein
LDRSRAARKRFYVLSIGTTCLKINEEEVRESERHTYIEQHNQLHREY